MSDIVSQRKTDTRVVKLPVSVRTGEQQDARYWVCPECGQGALCPFSCGGPHPIIKANGKPGKRLVYRSVMAVQMRPIEELRHAG